MNPTPQNNLQQFWRARAAVRNGNHAQHKDPLSRRHDSAGKAIEVSPQDYPLGHVSFLLFLMQNQTNFLIGLGSLLKNFGVTQPRLRIENTSGDPLNTYMIINGKQFDKIQFGELATYISKLHHVSWSRTGSGELTRERPVPLPRRDYRP